MRSLDLICSFGFRGGYTAEDDATDVEFSDSLYKAIKNIYAETGETYLEAILESGELSESQYRELERIIDEQKLELISVQHINGADHDPDTGEEYDFSELLIDIEINVPEEWDE